jgi:MoaA/NifB/PqqE/SkfB family radical SAM enzyme
MLYPILCNYYVTTRCNARCAFCDIYMKKGIDSKLEDVLFNLKGLKRIGIRFIDFTGGEPLLHPDLPEMLREAKRIGLATTVTTNCLLYPKRAREIAGLVNLLHFSLDSIRKSDHDALRGVPAFDLVLESITVAQTLGEKPDLLFTVTEENFEQIPEAAAFARRNRLMLLLNPVFSYFGNPGSSRKMLDAVLEAAPLPYVYVNRGIVRLMRQGGNRTAHPRCRAVTTTVVISPENTILLPCYHKALIQTPIEFSLSEWIDHYQRRTFQKVEGRFQFCEGCAISCYFDPSFTHGLDNYFFLSQTSKIKYVFDKYIRIFFA